MTLAELIKLCEVRLVYLSQLRTSYEKVGDISLVEKIDFEMSETQVTLNELKTLFSE